MYNLDKKAKQHGKTNKTNIFLAYSGHGTSISGNLHITLPTPITEEAYMQKCNSLVETFENLPLEDNDLTKFKELIEQDGVELKKGTVPSGPTKGNYQFELKSNFKDEELKKQMSKIFSKI